MEFVRSLRHLWRHRYFRRLLAVRVATQSCDGVLQIALASYVLFSPERQPDAVSIAIVLAITLLPFSILGPFVGVVLDRWSRRQILVVVDFCRAVLALGLAALVATGLRTSGVEAIFYGGVLLAMSLNRFLLAALSASLPHTIDAGEYMVANSVVPTVGPAGVLVGVGVGTSLRLILGARLPDYTANAILFVVAAAGFVLSASLALRIPRRQLGPDDVAAGEGPGHRRRTGRSAARTCGTADRAAIGLLTIGAHRIVYGIVTVATILVYRNYFHTLGAGRRRDRRPGHPGGDHRRRLRVRRRGDPADERPARRAAPGSWSAWSASAVFQVLPGAIYAKVPLGIAAFLLGLTAQNIKICVDTLVQAHVDDDFKGRVFVLYDMVFNVALVLAAVIGAVILPTNGKSVLILVILAVGYLVVAAWFATVSRGLSMNKGTESLQHVADSRPTDPLPS